MVSPLDTRSSLRESVPVAVILLFWMLLSSVVIRPIATHLLRAGIVMALLYTVVRGVALARTHQPTRRPDDLEGILRENVRVALPAGVWFLAAHLVYFIEQVWDRLGILGSVSPLVEPLVFSFSGSGVAVVVLYAVAVGLPRVRDTPRERDS